MREISIFTRREFFDYIWLTPLTVQTRDYGLTEIRMANLCAQYRLPCPPRGFWKRGPAGESKPRKPRFPQVDDPTISDRITLDKTHKFSRVVKKKPPMISAQTQGPFGPIVVPDTLPPNPHAISKRLVILLAKAKPDARGLFFLEAPPVSLELTERTLDRAIVLLDTLLVELERRGHSIEDGKVVVAGEPFTLRMREPEDIVPHVITNAAGPASPKWDYNPSGRLILDVQTVYFLRAGTKQGIEFWYNQGRFRIEDKLSFIINHMLAAAAKASSARAAAEQAERQRADAELRERLQAWRRSYLTEALTSLDRLHRLKALAHHMDEVATPQFEFGGLRQELSEMIADVEQNLSAESRHDASVRYEPKNLFG